MVGRAFYKGLSVSVVALVMFSVSAMFNGFSFHKFSKHNTHHGIHSPMLNPEYSHDLAVPMPPRGFGRQLMQAVFSDDDDEDAECREVHEKFNSSMKCEFVNRTEDCASDDGFFQYNYFVYCLLGHAVWGAMIVLILWWLFCFVGLAVCADDFFCPSLVVISKTLRLSPNVAGVTFLAFGNGAPDLFSAISALESMKDGDSGMGVGGLFGAGMFVTTVVVGTICVVRPFKAMERPYLRDVCFYMAGVYWTFFVLWKGYIHLAEAIGFIVAYVVYVIVVIVTGSIYKKQNEKAANKQGKGGVTLVAASGQLPPSDSSSSLEVQGQDNPGFTINNSELDDRRLSIQIDNKNGSAVSIEPEAVEKNGKIDLDAVDSGKVSLEVIDAVGKGMLSADLTDLPPEKAEVVEDEAEPVPLWKHYLMGLNPINVEEWPDMAWYGKAYEVFKAPIVFAINLTCPVVNYEVEDTHNWNKFVQITQCVLGPPIALLLIKVGTNTIGGVFPVWAVALLIGLALGILVFFTSKVDEKPVYHWVFGYIGFFFAIVWIYVIANEIVSLLETFGVVFNISNAILGLTLLAWGNSIGDWIADTVMARQGFARMGFAACIGAPFFNLMLGFGLPLIVRMAQKGETTVPMTLTGVQLILCTFLLGNLCISLILIVFVFRFKLNKPMGIWLLFYYIAFLVIAILTEVGVLLKGFKVPRLDQ